MNSWEQIGESMVRLLLAMVLGGVIGWQRESADKPAGFRTHILVSVGAALFTLVSAVGFFGTGADPARVASNIVAGIGFLGAGTIWRTGASVHGLTTSATLCTVAAICAAAEIAFSARTLLSTVTAVSMYTDFKVIYLRRPVSGLVR